MLSPNSNVGVWVLLLFCCLLSTPGEQSEAINHRSEAINQQEPCWAMALGGFVKCPLRLPFASGLRRSSTMFGVTCSPWGLSLSPKYLLIAFGTSVFVQKVWPLEQLEFWASPVNTDSLTCFWEENPVNFLACVWCLSFKVFFQAGVGIFFHFSGWSRRCCKS